MKSTPPYQPYLPVILEVFPFFVHVIHVCRVGQLIFRPIKPVSSLQIEKGKSPLKLFSLSCKLIVVCGFHQICMNQALINVSLNISSVTSAMSTTTSWTVMQARTFESICVDKIDLKWVASNVLYKLHINSTSFKWNFEGVA